MSVVDFPSAGVIGANLKPKRYDIELYQGDTFKFSLVLKNGGTPINITGWTPLAQIKRLTDSSPAETPVLTTTVTGIEGKINIGVDATGTSALDADLEYKYDLQLTDTDGNVRTFIGGKITVTADISR